MFIPPIVSRKVAVEKVLAYLANTPKPNVIPRCKFLHNGLGFIFLHSSEDELKDKDDVILYPLISSAGELKEDFSDYPLMNKVYIQDRLSFVSFLDTDVGGTPSVATFIDDDDAKTWYITVPSKGLSAIVPITLVQKSLMVRTVLNALPSEIPDLYKGFFEEIAKTVAEKANVK
jgi:hypothetical protein